MSEKRLNRRQRAELFDIHFRDQMTARFRQFVGDPDRRSTDEHMKRLIAWLHEADVEEKAPSE